jgi:hypothetical protein
MSEPRERETGATIDEFLRVAPDELQIDAVGMWQIVAMGKGGFELTDAQLVEFVRRYIRVLLEHGAKPVVGVRSGPTHWLVQEQYGSMSADIEDAVIDKWQRSPEIAEPGGLWFARPRLFSRRVSPRR